MFPLGMTAWGQKHHYQKEVSTGRWPQTGWRGEKGGAARKTPEK